MGNEPVPDIQATVIEGHLFDVTASLFGAVPDDGNDDTAAIQSAIDAAGFAGGGVVFLPKGRYEVHQKPENGFLQISHDNIILRGEGHQPSTKVGVSELAAPSETILHFGSPGFVGRIRRLGTVPAEQEGRHWTCVAVIGSEHSRELTRYTQTVLRGQKTVEVLDSSSLTPGQTVVVEFTDPLIDPENPLPDKADIPLQLTHPLKLVKEQTDTFGKYSKKITWITKIDKVIDKKTIVFSEPARFNQFLRYSPRILSFDGVEGVGIENLTIESSWPGGYRHHKPNIGEDGKIVRTAMEQDYLWGGIWSSFASDGWIRNVTFKNLTQGIIFSKCASITARDLSFEGFDGHAGVTIAQSHGILVERADFFARLVHPVSLKNFASGNVITDCETHYDGRDANNSTDAVIDFHGLFPYENLFDNMCGFYVCPGGDTSVMPHAGVRNVFWNIEAPKNMSCYSCERKDEFMRTYDYVNTSSGTPATMYEYQPQGFFIGLTRRGDQKVTMGGLSSDQHNKWMVVEGMNIRNLGIPSLYKAQYHWRFKKK
ncbi:putative virulence factor (pectin lyase fold protein) [Desulforapulum autotrophicum HRM2]|uniref:Virulence factor (Pectin lyase fold protein) n=1 Tax=Desulforapulum autotrophicum (strain ATCC 43914 / DSM 3382 / VKM B-1955 / HRM2) TaxID=177437 RepID=C0QGK8_DESAH|nr:glycosyl hydrolase family 28-related protein [Desulforapulum autotrophicum]ACN13483.1 putative virulence factor (pectin lyase fold protein) [Desulforapulum autotrophicum HRM2]